MGCRHVISVRCAHREMLSAYLAIAARLLCRSRELEAHIEITNVVIKNSISLLKEKPERTTECRRRLFVRAPLVHFEWAIKTKFHADTVILAENLFYKAAPV